MKLSRNQILDRTAHLAQKKGWRGITVRDISKAIGYSTIKIYSDFGGKEALLIAVQHRGFELLEKALTRAMNSHEDPKEQLLAASIAHVQFSFAHSAYYDLMFSRVGQDCEDSPSLMRLRIKQKIKVILNGALGTSDLPTTAHHLALVHGYALLFRDNPILQHLPLEATMKQYIEQFISGVRQHHHSYHQSQEQ